MCGFLSSSVSSIHNTPVAAQNLLPQVTRTRTHKYNVTEPGILTQVVRFQKSTGANGTTQDVNLNFTPKAIIVFSEGNNQDNTVDSNYQQSIGFSNGFANHSISVGSEDNSAVADAGRNTQTGYVFTRLSITAPTTTILVRGSCAFSTNKVTFTWTINDSTATYITLWAIGGSDIKDVAIGTSNIGRNTVGDEDYTGLGFTPQGDGHSVLFTLSNFDQSTGGFGGARTNAISMLGCATKAYDPHPGTTGLKQWYMSNLSENASDPSDTWRVEGSDRNFAVLNTTGGFGHYGWLKAWIEGGFRISWDGPPSSTDFTFTYMVINGGSWDAGTLTSPTSATNDVDYPVSVNSFPIKGMMLASASNVSNAVISTYSLYSIGATDGTNSVVISAIDEDNQATTDSYRYTATTSLAYSLTDNGVLTDRATFDSFTTDNFRLDWPTKSAFAQQYHWVVVALTSRVETTRTHKYNVELGVAFKRGYIVIPDTTGPQDIEIGFQPKALIIFGVSHYYLYSEAYVDNSQFAYGFSDGTNQICTNFSIDDNVATSNSASNLYNGAIYQYQDSNGSEYGRATLDQFLTRGFRLNWQVMNGVNGAVLEYIAIGGEDITNVKVGTQNVGTTTTGNKAYTGVGFQGDFMLALSSGVLPTGSAYTYNTTNESHAGFVLGCAKSSTARFAISTVSRDNQAAADSYRYQRGDKCFAYLDNSTGTKLLEADFVSFDTDGFTWNYSTNTTANNQNAPFAYMVIKGGVWDVGYFQSPTTNTTVVTNTSASGKLRGVQSIDVQTNLITSNTIQDTNFICCGASDGVSQSCNSTIDHDLQDPIVSAQIKSETYFIVQFIATAIAANSTLVGTATVSFSTSSFTTTWTNTDGNQRYIPYWAVSKSTAAAPQNYSRTIGETSVTGSEALARILAATRTISDTSISVNQTLARILGGVRPISDTSISVSEARARILGAIRTISDTSITTNDSIVKAATRPKTINETAITGNETLARILIATRPIAESSVSINDTIARVQTILRTISDPSITTNDSILAGLVVIRAITESAISTNDTIARVLAALRSISNESAITTNDSIARMIAVSYTLAEPSISVSQILVRQLQALRTVSESSISVNDTVAKLLAATRTISEASISINDTVARIQTILKQISDSSISINDSLTGTLLYVISLVESRVKWYYSLLTRKIGA